MKLKGKTIKQFGKIYSKSCSTLIHLQRHY